MLLGVDQEEINYPLQKIITIPIVLYNKLEEKKKPTELILDLLYRLIENSDPNLEHKYKKEIWSKTQQIKDETINKKYII